VITGQNAVPEDKPGTGPGKAYSPAAARPGRQPGWPLFIVWLAPLLFMGLFYLFPMLSILIASFARSTGGLLAPFFEALSSPALHSILAFTIWQAALSTLLTLAIGLPGAYLIARYDFPGKALLRALTGVPFVLPTLVVAAAFSALLGPQGWVNLVLMRLFHFSQPPIQLMYTLAAILLAHIFYNTTIVLRMVGDFWSHLDPHLGQAAETLGATPRQALLKVTLPLLMPAIATAALLIFIFDLTSFGVILVLGGPRFATLETEIYNQTVSLFNLPLAAVLALIQLAFTLLLTVIYTRLAARLTRPLTQRPRSYTRRRLTSFRQRLLAGVYIGLIVALLVAPLLALAARSISRVQVDERRPPGQVASADTGASQFLTLEYYRELNVNRRQSMFYVPPVTAVGISLLYAWATTLFALLLGIPAAWALARSQTSWVNRTLDPLLMLPLGTSAVTLGLGFVLALSRPPLDLIGSPWLVPLAHTLVAFPFVVRSLTPALRSIRPRLRQAAAVLGANPLQVFRFIDLPLVGRAVLVAASFAFTISLGEFGATAVLARPEYPTVPVVIYRLLAQPGALNYGQAMALSTILMAVAVVSMLIIEQMRIADVGEF
jgi:thiamine transport system permease protein